MRKSKLLKLKRPGKKKLESFNLEKEMRRVWKLTKTLNDDYQERARSTVIKDNETHLTGKLAANILAETFKENSQLEVPREKTAEVRQQIKNECRRNEASDCMTADFTMYELNSAINKLKNKKSPGSDGISNEMIKHLNQTGKTVLLSIFNQSWKIGTFPNKWKEATIIPVAKKRKRKNFKEELQTN